MVESDKPNGFNITGASDHPQVFSKMRCHSAIRPAAGRCFARGGRGTSNENKENRMTSRLARSVHAAALVLLLSGAPCSLALAAGNYKLIGTEELKTWMKSSAPPRLIYSLSFVEFEEQRIPGSICIPMELMAKSTDLPRSKDQPLVFYCKGPG